MSQYFSANTVRCLTGIQVNEDYIYQLINITLDDIAGLDKFYKYIDDWRENYYVQCMVDRLDLGGTLPAIILWDDMKVADGTHRTYAYIFATEKKIKKFTGTFYALVKRPLDYVEHNLIK